MMEENVEDTNDVDIDLDEPIEDDTPEVVEALEEGDDFIAPEGSMPPRKLKGFEDETEELNVLAESLSPEDLVVQPLTNFGNSEMKLKIPPPNTSITRDPNIKRFRLPQ